MTETTAATFTIPTGWSDDSRWARSAVTGQWSVLTATGTLGSVAVFTGGRVRWNVDPRDSVNPNRSQRGWVDSVDAAVRVVEDTINSVEGTLF